MAKKISRSSQSKKEIQAHKLKLIEEVCAYRLANYNSRLSLDDVNTALDKLKRAVLVEFSKYRYRDTTDNLALIDSEIELWRPKFVAKHRRLLVYQRRLQEKRREEQRIREEIQAKKEEQRNKIIDDLYDSFVDVFNEYVDDSLIKLDYKELINEKLKEVELSFTIKKETFIDNVLDDMGTNRARLLDYKIRIIDINITLSDKTFCVKLRKVS